jgi:hypothetical protein
MQVVCGNCQLSFDAPDGATGLVCPICRGPLRSQSADGAGPAAKTTQDWTGGDLDDLIAILSAPAVSARVEVLPPNGDAPAGEVHLLAGGVSEALFGGKSVDDALDKLRAIKLARFRIEPRLPNPADGDLGTAGPEAGTLESRALAHLMRYCEDYVITCAIEVWRGNENARVDYKRGEISGVTVGGIDAPERLAEVMQWSSGNYRLVVPPLKLPATAPKRPQAATATPAPVPAPAPSAQAARQASATKTMFGIPLAEVQKARAAADAAIAAKSGTPGPTATGKTGTPGSAPIPAPAATPAPVPASAALAQTLIATPSPAAKPAPAAAAPPPAASSATKTIFGVPAPTAPGGYIPGGTAAPPAAEKPRATDGARAAAERREAELKEAERKEAERREADKKTGARKVSVPAPEVGPPPAAVAAAAPPAAAAARAETTDPVRRAPAAAPAPVTRAETTEPMKRVAPATPAEKPRGAPVVTWAIVGVFFGAVFLLVYYFVGQLGH